MPRDARDAVEPGRLRRAAHRAVKPLGDGHFMVQGTVERAYAVDLTSDTPCTCADAWFHGRGCLHELAARMASGDMGLIHQLAALYEPQVRAEREMGLTDGTATEGDDEAE